MLLPSSEPGAASQQNRKGERERREMCYCHPSLTPLHLFPSLKLKESRYIGRQVWVPAITTLALFPARNWTTACRRHPTQQLKEPRVQRRVFFANLWGSDAADAGGDAGLTDSSKSVPSESYTCCTLSWLLSRVDFETHKHAQLNE